MKAAIERTFLVNVLCAAVCLFGLFTLWNMKRDLIPPLSWPFIQISAELSGATVEEMERLVTFPLEEALKGISNVKEMSSTTSPGSTSIWLEFRPEKLNELDLLQNDVKDQISRVRHRLPLDLKTVDVTVDKVRDVFLATYSIENYDSKNSQHRAVLRKLQGQINQIPGVAQVNVWQDDRNLFVRLDPVKLARSEISIPQVRAALSRYIAFEPLGQVRWDGQRYGVQMKAQEIEPERITQIPLVANRTGNVVRLGDVASVEWDSWETQAQWLWNGKKVAEIEVRKDLVSDSIQLHESVKGKIAELNQALPSPLNIVEAFDGPRFIRKQIEVLSFNGWFGFILVVLTLGIFLGFRSALMTAWGLPVSYLGTFIVLSWFGISIDLLSILGLILVVGILVDDAIIVTDRYNDHLQKGLRPKEAAYLAARELVLPVTGTILTTVVAFLPLMTIPSNLTWFLKAIPLVVIVSLAVSWAESFFVLPNHLAHFVKRAETPVGTVFMNRMKDGFEKSLRVAMRYRWSSLAAVLALVVASFYVAGKKLQHHFNISIGSEQIVVFAELTESSSLDETIAKLQPLFTYVATIDKNIVEYSSAQVGRYNREGEQKEGFRFARVVLGINGNHPRPVELRKTLQPKIATQLEKLKSSEFVTLTAEERKRGEEDYNKNTVAVHITGRDEAVFAGVETSLRTAAKDWPHIESKDTEDNQYMQVWTLSPDLDVISRYGLTRDEVSAQIREHISAYEVGEVRAGGEAVSILTQVKYPDRIQFQQLNQIPVLNPPGEKIPLSWLGEWKEERVPREIRHDKGVRYSEVKFKFDDKHYNVETAKAAIAAQLASIRAQFPGVDLSVENANQRDEDNKKWITKVTFYSLVGVAVVLLVLLGSFSQPFFVMIPVPIGIAGALLALWIHDMALTIMAMIGLMGVIGVSVNSSIVLTHHFNRLREVTKHLSRSDIAVAAARSRLRAVFLTSVTTLGGLFPTAYGIFGESGFTQPIAFTMAWGVLASTLASLYVLPLLLSIGSQDVAPTADMSDEELDELELREVEHSTPL